jgi:hypothetical protein
MHEFAVICLFVQFIGMQMHSQAGNRGVNEEVGGWENQQLGQRDDRQDERRAGE